MFGKRQVKYYEHSMLEYFTSIVSRFDVKIGREFYQTVKYSCKTVVVRIYLAKHNLVVTFFGKKDYTKHLKRRNEE